MNKLRILIYILLLLISCKKEDTQQSLDEQIERIAKSHIIFGRTPGIAIGIVNGGIEKNYFFGTKNLSTGDQIDEYTIFEIGSVTKTFTALLFADFVIKNEISLTDSLNSYLPDNIQAPEKDGIPIRFVDLLNHTSGIPREPAIVTENNSFDNFNEEDLKDYFDHLNLKSVPGAKYKYSNLGMGLAGYIISKLKSTGYNELIKQEILNPFGMVSTACTDSEITTDNIAQGYYGNEKTDFYRYSEIFAPSGVIKSNLHDMMIYLNENISCSHPVLSDALELVQVKTFDIEAHQSIALGWHINEMESGDEIYWHNGGSKGFSSFIAFNRATNEGVVVLINSYCFGEQDIIGIEIMNLLNKF